MTLPTSICYSFEEPLPRNRISWDFVPGDAALLIHDMQHWFTRVYSPDCPAYAQSVRQCQSLLEFARNHAIPIAYTAQPGSQKPSDRGLLTDVWGPGLPDEPWATDIIDELAPTHGERVFTKHRYSAFARSDFDDWLTDHGRSQLVIAGIYCHIGVAMTALDAFMRDVKPFVVADATADFSAEDHSRGLAQVAGSGGTVVTTADLLAPHHQPLPAGARR